MLVRGVHHYNDSSSVIRDLDAGILTTGTRIMFKLSGSDWREVSVGQIQVYEVTGLLIDYDLDKSGVRKLTLEITKTYSKDVAAEVLHNLMNLMFKTATQSGLSLGMDDFSKSEVIADRMKETKLAAGNYEGMNRAKLWDDNIQQSTAEWIGDQDPTHPLMIMMKSGARVNDTQIRQMVIAKGLLTNMQGELNVNAVSKSLAEGLDTIDYFNTCGPARRGLADNHFLVPASGYLERQLANVCRELTITARTCGTTNTILIGREHALGRYMSDDFKITREYLDSVDDTHFNVRSPITCNHNYGLCAVCCGDNPATEQDWRMGTGIGIMAAQTAVEPATQLSLRGKHTSGSVVLEDYGKQVSNSLGLLISALGARSTTNLPLGDIERYVPQGVDYRSKAVDLAIHLKGIYSDAGIKINTRYLEVIVRGVSDVVEVGGTAIIRSQVDEDYTEIAKILGCSRTLSAYPSWLKSSAHGYAKKNIVRAVATLTPTQTLPSERIMMGIPIYEEIDSDDRD